MRLIRWQNLELLEQRLLLGPLSGKHIVNYYLKHILGFIPTSEETLKAITWEFKEKARYLPAGKSPRSLLEKIADAHQLVRIEKPKTHVEVLD